VLALADPAPASLCGCAPCRRRTLSGQPTHQISAGPAQQVGRLRCPDCEPGHAMRSWPERFGPGSVSATCSDRLLALSSGPATGRPRPSGPTCAPEARGAVIARAMANHADRIVFALVRDLADDDRARWVREEDWLAVSQRAAGARLELAEPMEPQPRGRGPLALSRGRGVRLDRGMGVTRALADEGRAHGDASARSIGWYIAPGVRVLLGVVAAHGCGRAGLRGGPRLADPPGRPRGPGAVWPIFGGVPCAGECRCGGGSWSSPPSH